MPEPLRDYQELAVKFITNVPRCGLFLDPGLGKTATVLSALDPSWFPALVIAPKAVAENTWPAEVAKWRPDLFAAFAVGTRDVREGALGSGADVTVISRDNAAEAISRRGATRPRWRSMIYDESSGIKTRGTSRWKVARHLGGRAERVVLLSGTPAPNSLADLWAQLKILDGGERLCKNITQFRRRYFYPAHRLPSGIVTEWRLLEDADKKIHAKVEDICLGMQAEYRLELPTVTHNEIAVTIPAKARRIYNDLRTELITDIEDVFGDIETVTAGNSAILSSKLSQVAAGALYPDLTSEKAGRAVPVHNAKREALESLLESLQGSPALVFYRYRFEADWLSEIPGARSIRARNVIADWNAGKVPVLYAHPASAAHGLNLQFGGHHAVWTSPTWDPELWEQANARLARPGQKNPVIIHMILADGSIDSKVIRRLEDKGNMQDALREAIESPI